MERGRKIIVEIPPELLEKAQQVTMLFHPRRKAWSDHFHLDGEWIIGLTATGRATVQVLAMNDPRRRELRCEIAKYGNFT